MSLALIYFRSYIGGMKPVPEAFREARKALGITQTELAKHIDCTQGFIAQIESGWRSLPKHILKKLPAAIRNPVIDASIAELMEQADKLERMR
jgi:predicted transcriptional regulator